MPLNGGAKINEPGSLERLVSFWKWLERNTDVPCQRDLSNVSELQHHSTFCYSPRFRPEKAICVL